MLRWSILTAGYIVGPSNGNMVAKLGLMLFGALVQGAVAANVPYAQCEYSIIREL